MVHCCCVPGCSTRSDREIALSFFTLPLSNKKLLIKWVHVIRRSNLPVNRHTRICSRHFVNAEGRRLYKDEVPSLCLPGPSSTVPTPRKSPRDRSVIQLPVTSPAVQRIDFSHKEDYHVATMDSTMQTELNLEDLAVKDGQVSDLEKRLKETEKKLQGSKFSLDTIKSNEAQVTFYTGFPSFVTLKAFFNFLGPAVYNLKYSKRQEESDLQSGMENKRLRQRILSPLDEFFMTLVRLRLGLVEQDLAYRFGVSQSTVSRITCTWINFLYTKLKEIPIWPPKELVQANMPTEFKTRYPSTRVVLDATEIHIEQPHLPELQQMTFSNYKNHNTFKALVGISPDGVITFVSSLFPGSISDKLLTKRSGILDLIEEGDSVMADRGFDIEDDLMLLGAHLNMPPFLRGKSQFSENDLVITRRIASLRIHVERAMERIKNFHIFDKTIPVSLTDIADRIFFVCCILSNFHQPLVK